MKSRQASRRSLFFSGILLASGLVVLSSARAEDSNDSLANMRRAGVAKIAIASLPRYAFMSPDGQPQGYLVDISTLAMKALGVPKVEATVTTWDAMIPGLQARQFDFAPAGLNITSARCQVVLFSAPVTAQQDALYLMPGNPKHLTGYTSISKTPDAKVAVLSGSQQEAFALHQGVTQDQLVKVPDLQAGIAAVTGGRANAFVVGQFSIPNPEQKGLELVVDTASPMLGIGMAFRKDSAQARDAFNKQLEVLRANGTMKNLYTKYGFNNWETLAKVTKASDLVTGCE
jgi:polar amino acid transport system substrate-binding protein